MDKIKDFDALSSVNVFNREMQEKQKKMIESVNRSSREAIAREEKKIGLLQSLDNKMESVGTVLDTIVNSIGANSQLQQNELIEIKRLLLDMQEVSIGEEDEKTKDSKMTAILKKGLSFGGQVAMSLMVEYIKYQAKMNGFPIA